MYRVEPRDGGSTVATIHFDPYRFSMKASGHAGVQRVLSSMESREQLNRTSGGELAYEPDAPGSHGTSPETYQEPSDEFLLDRIHDVLRDGYILVEGERE